ncbi:MAG: NERD domain-containing protein [Actinomycetota bacterium]
MGRLVPDDFPLSSLVNGAERQVVEAFRDGLSDGWLILPDVGLRADRRDHQLDVVLVHAGWGVVDIEVKGHRMTVRDGAWCSDGRPLDPQPMQQARANAYALRDTLRAMGGELSRLDVEYGVALPNTVELDGLLPPDVAVVQLLTASSLEEPQDAIEALVSDRRGGQALSPAAVEAIVATLRPDVELTYDPEARARSTRQRLDEICANQVAALETLDANRRAYVSGRAGTGKTRLAMGWARRAFVRDERVLLTCYNDPLAAGMAAQLPDDERLVIGGFLRVALELDGMPSLPIPELADHEWWTVTAVEHLQAHWHQVTERFDTIVVDEGQDFSPTWMALLERLLDPDGPRRMLVVADDAQDLYTRGFLTPSPEDGWAVAELVNNCRNTHEIARLLRRHLDGARSPAIGPSALGVEWLPAPTLPEVVDAVNARLVDLLEIDERDPSSIVVATFTTSVRDALRVELGLVPWEQRGIGRIACENVHRIKGLEADCVILASPTADVADALLYVGISRAVSQLVLVGPQALAARVGLG